MEGGSEGGRNNYRIKKNEHERSAVLGKIGGGREKRWGVGERGVKGEGDEGVWS